MPYGEIDRTFIRALDKSRSICSSKKGGAALKDNVKSNLIYNVEFFFCRHRWLRARRRIVHNESTSANTMGRHCVFVILRPLQGSFLPGRNTFVRLLPVYMGAGRLKNISIPLLVEISPPTSNPVGGALLFPTLSRLGVHLVEPAFRTITRNVRPFVPFERLKIFRKLLRENGSGSMDNRASSVSKAEKIFSA